MIKKLFDQPRSVASVEQPRRVGRRRGDGAGARINVASRQAFPQFRLRTNLGEDMLDKLSRLRKTGIARLLVRSWAGEVASLAADRLLKLGHIAAANKHQLGAHQFYEVQERSDGRASRFGEERCRLGFAKRGRRRCLSGLLGFIR
jgi:hypothetical protein